MSYAIYFDDDEISEIKKVIPIIGKLLFKFDQAKAEEVHEREFNNLFKNCGVKPQHYSDDYSANCIQRALTKKHKELKQIKMKFKEIINVEWLNAHLRQKPNGVYEIRCSIDYKAISGSGKTIDRAVENFITKFAATLGGNEVKPPVNKSTLVNDFAEKWFELIKKPTVKPGTLAAYKSVYDKHCKLFFKKKIISELTAMQIQPLFVKLIDEGKNRTVHIVYNILSQLFKSAVAERVILNNPIDSVRIPKHEQKKGVALTMHEERALIKSIQGTFSELGLALLLYAGMRRGELNSARMENGFIVVTNGKTRRGMLNTERKIPITPMLAPYLNGLESLPTFPAGETLTHAFKRICPDHHLHELRHTFITRCQECGVPREVVSVWAGHAADHTMTSNVYTHFSDDYMKNEAKKVNYYNRLRD